MHIRVSSALVHLSTLFFDSTLLLAERAVRATEAMLDTVVVDLLAELPAFAAARLAILSGFALAVNAAVRAVDSHVQLAKFFRHVYIHVPIALKASCTMVQSSFEKEESETVSENRIPMLSVTPFVPTASMLDFSEISMF
jgi:hypothetical protein